MKWWKTALGILLIAAAVAAMYFWNAKGREKMMALEAEKAAAEAEKEVVVDSRIGVLALEKSYFVIPKTQIYHISNYIKAGDIVGIYHIEHLDTDEEYTPEKYGSFEIANIGEDTVEIICDLSDFSVLYDAGQLLFVLEEVDG